MAANLMAVKGRVQREGEVVHLIAHQIADLSADLATVGGRDNFTMPASRADHARHGGPDPRDLPPKGLRTRNIYIPLCRVRHKGIYPEEETMPSAFPKSRDFR
jgi:hypothetical protein